jgi:hypothetical protein
VLHERAVIDISLSHLSGQPSAPQAQLQRNCEVRSLQVPYNGKLSVTRGDRVVLRALTLPGQACHTAWDVVVRTA